ncbi:unnamed protein product [Schistosoma mattheei]|uniref:Uncharacterized protein n=2 Tax=Schistosoma TaxID=6181 RepID=A0A3P8CBF5_9TREM|nr:unnamed protein product [Schistosoma mattheei]
MNTAITTLTNRMMEYNRYITVAIGTISKNGADCDSLGQSIGSISPAYTSPYNMKYGLSIMPLTASRFTLVCLGYIIP